MSVLHDLIEMGNDFERLRELLREGENPNIVDIVINTPLHVAVFKKEENVQEFEANLQVVRELIYFGADVNLGNFLGNTPLHFAVGLRNYKMMKILLKFNAEIDRRDVFGNTALHYAINNCSLLQRTFSNLDCRDDGSHADLNAVKLLLKYRPNINMYNYRSETPLMWAVKEQNFPIVQKLLEEGAFHYLEDLFGNKALHYALDQTEIDVNIVAELIRNGSNHASKNNQSLSPVDMYLKRLSSASPAEDKKANCLFKLFVFQKNNFKSSQSEEIAIINKKKNFFLREFFWYCRFEIEKMKSDELARDYTVYDLASWGFYYFISEEKAPSCEVFPIILDKLKKGQYTVYCDIILSGICRQYLANKTAETGFLVNRRGEREEFLNFDTRYHLCYYLTNFEMFSLILAFSLNNSFSKICKICNVLYETV